MKVYKEKQFLVFDFEDGKNVKYNLATGETIGKSGKIVKGLQHQLSGISMNNIIESCEDKNYGLFLKYVWDKYTVKGYSYYDSHYISNVGTVLSHVKEYSDFEQLYSAGIGEYIHMGRWEGRFIYKITDIPSSLIKFIKNGNIKYINNNIVKNWINNPDACCIAFELEFISLNKQNLNSIINNDDFFELINTYNYNAKALLLYLDQLKTFEAINASGINREILDYASMMSKISPKYDKYPKNFLTTHQIACRNYDRLRKQFNEIAFQEVRNPKYECSFGKYIFIYPKTIDDIKEEAVQQSNCVASYIQRVIDGECHILFMRLKEDPNKSLITIEVNNDRITQAKGKYNRELTPDEEDIVTKWNAKFAKRKGETAA